MSRRALALLAALLLVSALAPVATASRAAGSYIVVFEDSVTDPRLVAREHANAQNAKLGYVYQHALKGYSAMMSEAAAARVSRDPRVAYVEADGVVTKVATQTDPTWGLDRIDDQLGLDKSYEYSASGSGVRAYIIDSGIDVTHTDFGGRAVSGVDKVDNDADSDDCDGHGTHVAGTVGSSTYGVAKGVTLVGVRVLDCSGSGTWSGVIAGIDWVTADHAGGAPAVANMSLGGGLNTAVNDAVARSTEDGVTYAVAAGNGDQAGRAQDACTRSPASAPSALTVGATNDSDTKASWSNYGTCVDLFAPGVGITSTTMDGGTATWNGTSMASPHVAGVAALYLQADPTASPAAVAQALTQQATQNVVISPGTGSPNRLLYSLVVPATYEPPPPPGSLTARAYKVKNSNRVDLTWSGSPLVASVDVYRNGTKVTTTSNDGAHTDSMSAKNGGGSFTYKVCNAGTSDCSNEVTVTY